MLRRLGVLLALLVATLATASVGGWTPGTPAKNAARVLQGLPEPVRLELPEALADRITGPTFLVYFSPSCPHCQAAQPELNELARTVAGKADVIGIASSRNTKDTVDRYQRQYKVAYPIVLDEDALIGAEMRARSTPSVMFVERRGKRIVATDAWYPYRRGTVGLLRMRVEDDPWKAFTPGAYQGTATCASCHTEEAAAWMLTPHSIAWETLLAKDADRKPECVGCHVVGHGDPQGWTPDRDHLVDVGCEACHGPGGPHDGERAEATASCAGCHDAKHSIAFSVAKGLPHIDHFVGNTLDDAAFRERLRGLHDGERERPLLAFAEGPHVGSATCQSCHEAEHAWWAADPHGRALASLADATHEGRPAAEQVACVRCHASPKVHGGAPPASLDDLVLDEGGVGCESCHGPGGAHVQAGGGSDNIEGLGEDCPVCVLEALCTSCHTRKWDPEWRLERRLGAVAHGK